LSAYGADFHHKVDDLLMHYGVIGISLYLFWLLLSGHYTGLMFGLGGLSVALVIWVLHRMDRVDREPHAIRPTPGLLRYGIWLLGSVIKSNLDVVRRIWDPALPIQPTLRRLDTRVRSTTQKTLYANSITLTPGTLTTDVAEDHFMVHSLAEEGIRELEEGGMEDRIQRLSL
jgi:multicomponent Na+:H+ antiporter subunit E